MTTGSSHKPNAQYNTAAPDSLVIRVTAAMRRRMYETFIKICSPSPVEKILDVGVTSDQTYQSSNYLEAWYPNKAAITACGIDDASFLEALYPGLVFVSADAKNLPFADSTFDLVHSSAVIEHVGSRDQQRQFIAELVRVAKRSVCLTTPNRWFPIEVHTSIPLLHWLPVKIYRSLLSRIGYRFFANEENLNLLSANDLVTICEELEIADFKIRRMRLLGWTSNLVLFIDKPVENRQFHQA